MKRMWPLYVEVCWMTVAILLLYVCGSLGQEKPKVQLKDVDSAVKQTAAEQAAASAALLKANKAQAAAVEDLRIRAALEAYKAQERSNGMQQTESARFKVLEDGLKQVRDDRAAEIKAEKDAREAVVKQAAIDHHELMITLRNAFIGVVATLLTALVLFISKAAADRRHQSIEQSQIAAIKVQNNTIHSLVNSGKTALMRRELAGYKRELALLLANSALLESLQKPPDPVITEAIIEAKASIVQCQAELLDQLRATDCAASNT